MEVIFNWGIDKEEILPLKETHSPFNVVNSNTAWSVALEKITVGVWGDGLEGDDKKQLCKHCSSIVHFPQRL